MFALRRILRFLLLSYALYTFAMGILAIISAEDTHDLAEDPDTIREFGTAPLEPIRAMERLTVISHQVCGKQPLLSMSSSPLGAAIKHLTPP
jgi:hypothetical protein